MVFCLCTNCHQVSANLQPQQTFEAREEERWGAAVAFLCGLPFQVLTLFSFQDGMSLGYTLLPSLQPANAYVTIKFSSVPIAFSLPPQKPKPSTFISKF